MIMLKFVAMTLEFYDILQGIISGVDYPGLEIMPVPLIVPLAIAANAGLQAYSAYKSGKDADDAKTAAEIAQEESRKRFDQYSNKLRDLAAQRREVGQGAYDIAGTRRTLAETRSQDLKDSLNRIEAATTSRIGDMTSGRGGNLTAALNAINQQRLQAGAATANEKLQADIDLFNQEQFVEDQNFQRMFDTEKFLIGQQQNMAMMDEQRAFDAGQAAIQQGAMADAAMFDAFGNAASSLVGVYGAPSGRPASTAAELGLTSLQEEGGLIPKGKAGMAIKTPGEFSHATNPLAVFQGEQGMTIEDKKGKEVAEFTGDEIVVEDETETFVFNPDQQTSIQKLIDEGDAKGLLKYMKALTEKFEKDAEAHEEMKEQNV